MAQLHVTLSLRKRWWFGLAYRVGIAAYACGLIRDAHSEEHQDGRITAAERLARWLVDRGMVITAK